MESKETRSKKLNKFLVCFYYGLNNDTFINSEIKKEIQERTEKKSGTTIQNLLEKIVAIINDPSIIFEEKMDFFSIHMEETLNVFEQNKFITLKEKVRLKELIILAEEESEVDLESLLSRNQ